MTAVRTTDVLRRDNVTLSGAAVVDVEIVGSQLSVRATTARVPTLSAPDGVIADMRYVR